MQVSYQRTGGFAGMRMTADFDLNDLPEQDARSIRDLVDKAGFSKLPDKIVGSAAVPDEFTYNITVSDDSGKHTVMTTDSAAPADLRPLIDLLTQLTRTRGRG